MTIPRAASPRRLILLGSTGSIGVNALAVVEHLRRRQLMEFEVVGLAAGANGQALCEQAKAFGVNHVAIADANGAAALRGVQHVHVGPAAAEQLIDAVAKKGDLVVGAMVGSAGLPATLAAIERGCDIALANKETLVAAGSIVMPLVAKRGVNILPVDSEHSAIFQCVEAARQQENEGSGSSVDARLRRIILTASGGPFRTWNKSRMENASVEEALNHPTWNMGPKVTIDSASLMNKALEIIEAHWLFGLPPEKIEVIIHPQSLIHSFVEFVDGSTLAQLGPPDMKSPIQYALTWPARLEGCCKPMDWPSLRKLDFEPVDHDRFGAPRLAYRVIESGGTAGAILNAANEAAVAAFLQRRISFGEIARLVEAAIDAIAPSSARTIEDVLQADHAARRWIDAAVGAETGRIGGAKRFAGAAEPAGG